MGLVHLENDAIVVNQRFVDRPRLGVGEWRVSIGCKYRGICEEPKERLLGRPAEEDSRGFVDRVQPVACRDVVVMAGEHEGKPDIAVTQIHSSRSGRSVASSSSRTLATRSGVISSPGRAW